MSIGAITWFINLERKQFSSSQKFVLFVIANSLNQDGYGFPSVRFISKVTELGESTVRRVLGELETNGHITRAPRADDRGRQTSNWYRLTGYDPPVDEMSDPLAARGGPSHKYRGGVPQREGQEEPSFNLTNSNELVTDETSSQVPTRRGPKPRAAHPLPANWAPNETHPQLAESLHLDLQHEVDKFRDHHEFRGTLGKNWNAGFSNWLRKAGEYRAEQIRAGRAPQTKADLPANYRRFE